MAKGRKEKSVARKRAVRTESRKEGDLDTGKPGKSAGNHEQQKIARWLKTVRFRRTLVGGIDERDLWKKLETLDAMYGAALSAERARYDALLEKQSDAAKREDKQEASTQNNAVEEEEEYARETEDNQILRVKRDADEKNG